MKVSDLLKESLGIIDNMDGVPVARKLYERENPSLESLLLDEDEDEESFLSESGEFDENHVLEEARGKRRKRSLKKVGGVHKMVRLKKTDARTLAKGRIKSKTAKSKLQRKRKERKNIRSASFKKRARSLQRAAKRFGKKVSGAAAKVLSKAGKGMQESGPASLIDRINQELNESYRIDEPSRRSTVHTGGVTQISDQGSFDYAYQDASTSPRQTVTFGSPIMPYLDNLSLSEELAGKLAEMSRDAAVAGKLVEFAEKCGSIVSAIESRGFTRGELEDIRGTAFEASGIVTSALRQFEELGYFVEGSLGESKSSEYRYRIAYPGAGQWMPLRAKSLKDAIREATLHTHGANQTVFWVIQDRFKDPDFGWLTVYRPK